MGIQNYEEALKEIRRLDVENERLRVALGELILRHDIGGTTEQIQAAWDAARKLLEP